MRLRAAPDGVNLLTPNSGERSSAGRASVCGFTAFRDPDDLSTLPAYVSQIYHAKA